MYVYSGIGSNGRNSGGVVKVRKDPKLMNFGLQVATFEKLLKNRKIERDTLDLKCILDSCLTYEENLVLLAKYLGISALRGDDDCDSDCIQQAKDFDEQAKEWFIQTYGDQALKQLEKANKVAMYAKIEVLGEVGGDTFTKYKTDEVKVSSSIRITSVYELPTVKLMLKKMVNVFKESGFRDYCIFDFGRAKFFQDLEKYSTFRLIKLNDDCYINFSGDHRKFKQNLDFKNSILKGESGHDLHIFCSSSQKLIVKKIIDFFGPSVFKETTIANIYLIYSINSMFRCNKQIQKYENAHYYYSDDGLISNIRKQLIDFRETVVNHFINILPSLREELRIKQLNQSITASITASENIQLKIATIKNIEAIIKETKDQFAGLHDQEEIEHVNTITVTNSEQ